jgi:hypothetical protein
VVTEGGLLRRLCLENQLAVLELHRHPAVVGDLAGDEPAGERGSVGVG